MRRNLAATLKAATNDPGVCHALLERLKRALGARSMRFMEVCGTHTTAIFQSGIRSLLPENLVHISGPGCPVCVTAEAEVDLILGACEIPNAVVATFGDLARVPGPDGRTLKHMQAAGAHVRIVYSPLDAVELARATPHAEIIFPAVGFETTAPTVAAAIMRAKADNVRNFSVISLHKLIPPALAWLLAQDDNRIDGFLLPGHVATVIGLAPFGFLAGKFARPAVVGGFEPAEILLALCLLAELEAPAVANAYPLAVDDGGNPRARELLNLVFEPRDALWRGLGEIAASGLGLPPAFAEFDAAQKFSLRPRQTKAKSGCRCGEVLQGKIRPDQCALFGKKCTPGQPVGPCMVSNEGSCAAYYKYGDL